jgi:hypothetical protein
MPFLTKRNRFVGRGCSWYIAKLLSLSYPAGRIFASLPTAALGGLNGAPNHRMKTAIITSYEGHYHHGVAALINSALSVGIDGVFIVAYRDRLPPWAQSLTMVASEEYEVAKARINFFRETSPRHFGYNKPFFALNVFDRYPDIDLLFYADPDIVFLAPWSFFQDWANLGIALVEDSNFPRVQPNHPWRAVWKNLLSLSGLEAHSVTSDSYANSGFFGISRRDLEILKLWADVTLAYEGSGKSTKSFQMVNRWEGVVGDQDLLAAAMMAWRGPSSIMGPEAMGFTGHYFILSHAIESPKPWAKSYFVNSLKGMSPTVAGNHFLRATSGPIKSFSKADLFLRRMDFRAAQLVSRVWRRA